MAFPNLDNIDVYRVQNNFDYTRWTVGTKIKLCSVPWCGDYDNVVKFNTEADRIAWFDAVPGYSCTLDSDFRMLPNGSIKLPLPFDVMAGFNYVSVEFPLATSASQLVDYEQVNGKRRWYFFVNDINMLAPSTTEAVLSIDWWTTFINDVQISYMQLERGHAPLAASSVDDYLAAPSANCDFLLAPDVNGAGPDMVKHTANAIINGGSMLVCFVSTADLLGAWGTKSDNTWEVAEFITASQDGVPVNYSTVAVAAADYTAFMAYVEANIPQYVQTVQGIFFLPSKTVTAASAGTVGTVEVYRVTASEKNLADITLNREMFGFPDAYADLAKLYTYPYSRIEITDFEGRRTEVRIEEITDGVHLKTLPNLLFPYVNIEVLLAGVGGAESTVEFTALDAKTLQIGGKWYEHVLKCNVPVYGLTQGNSLVYDYSTHFSLRQTNAEINLAESMGIATNAVTLANTNRAITTANANFTVAKTAAKEIKDLNNSKLSLDRNADNHYIDGATEAQIDFTQASTTTNIGVQIANAAVGVATLVAGVVAAPATGGTSAVAAVGASAARIAGTTMIANAAINVAATSTNSNLTITNNETIASLSKRQNNTKTDNAVTLNDDVFTATYGAQRTQLTNSNDVALAQQTAVVNNSNSNYTQTAELARTGLTRQRSQAELQAPARFGSATDASSAATKPMGVQVNVVTQNRSAIRTAGDAFLRYGYALNQNWTVLDLNVMPKFTYWKASDIWVGGNRSCIESAQQIIKDILLAGVTVWRRPDDIGNVSIYEN